MSYDAAGLPSNFKVLSLRLPPCQGSDDFEVAAQIPRASYHFPSCKVISKAAQDRISSLNIHLELSPCCFSHEALRCYLS